MQLVRYEQARTALAECHRVDEVKDIRDKAEAMAAYARQAKDQDLILWATEIKVRAERKAGEMLARARENGERAGSGGSLKKESPPSTLSDIGVSKDQSARWQQLASMSEDHFEAAVATAKDTAGQVTTAFMLREAEKVKQRGKPKTGPKAEAMREQLKAAKADSLIVIYGRLLLNALRTSAMSGDLTQQERELLVEIAGAIQARASENV